MSCGNGSFKKNPWLAERSQVTTRWGKKSATFDDGDASMEVFPLNSNVCVLVWIYIRMCVYFWLQTDHPAHMRAHTHTQPHWSACWFLSHSQTLHCKSLSPHAAQRVAEHQWPKKQKKTKSHWLKQWRKKIKFAALKVTEHHIESLGVTIFFKFLFFS